MIENIKFHKYQFDGIKIETLIRHKDQIKWNNLINHPTIRKNYCLKPELSPFAKNFKLYKRGNGQVVMNFSIPYFLKGHNYMATPYETLNEFKGLFFELVGVDVSECRVLEYEFGAFETINTDSKSFTKSIIGVSNLDLLLSNAYMKMFGDLSKGIQYKIYDAVYNSKKKKTFSRGGFPSARLIKHELKITKTQNLFGSTVFSDGFMGGDGFYDQCKELLYKYRKSIVFKDEVLFKPLSTDTTNIIYTCLKSVEHKLDDTIPNLMDNIIESADLSPSQRSKRRKNIMELDKMYNQSVNR